MLPLLVMNPMGKDHVTALLDALLALDADGVGARAAADASAALADVPGDYKAALVVADDLMGGGTNRYAYEFTSGSGCDPPERRAAVVERFWVTGVLWSSEAPTERAVREAVLTAAYRAAYVQRHGPARTLREHARPGRAGHGGGGLHRARRSTRRTSAYTREVLRPFLDAGDMRTAVECLFGDAAGRTLGFTPRGLSPWAGLALALFGRSLRPGPLRAAREGDYERALAEIRGGRKRSHWMWYIFPQLDGLGSSSTSKRYAIKSIEEAEAYLGHPILGPRLLECAEAALRVEGRSASEVFGSPDDQKLRSCATLFACVSPPGSVFDRLLGRYYGGGRDGKTLQLLGITPEVG